MDTETIRGFFTSLLAELGYGRPNCDANVISSCVGVKRPYAGQSINGSYSGLVRVKSLQNIDFNPTLATCAFKCDVGLCTTLLGITKGARRGASPTFPLPHDTPQSGRV